MKRIYVALLVFLISINYGFGQSFGVKGGVNLSTISSDSWDKTNSKVGFYAGMFLHAHVTNNFCIQPELIFNNMGVKYESGNTVHTLGLNYIAMPVMFQLEPIPNLYFEAGPQFSLLLGSRNKFEVGEKVTIEKDKDAFNQFDLNLAVGTGFRFKGNMALTARYLIGLTDVKKYGQTSWGNDDNELRNNGLQIGLQYGF